MFLPLPPSLFSSSSPPNNFNLVDNLPSIKVSVVLTDVTVTDTIVREPVSTIDTFIEGRLSTKRKLFGGEEGGQENGGRGRNIANDMQN